MAKQEKKQENILIKIYILALFLCGIGLWFALSNEPKQKLSIDVELEQKVVDTLAANGIKQTDIIAQYTRERETTTKIWSEFYKKIQLRGDKRSEKYENALRGIARSMKLGLSKTDNVDGTVTYKFYSSNINYSNITFVNPKKSVSVSSVSSSKSASTSKKTSSSKTSASSSSVSVSKKSASTAAKSASSAKISSSTANTKKKITQTKVKK